MEILLGFGSAHKALKAESILKEKDVPFRLLPVPRTLDPACGLVIRISEEEFSLALGILKEGGLEPKSIYRKEGEEYVKV